MDHGEEILNLLGQLEAALTSRGKFKVNHAVPLVRRIRALVKPSAPLKAEEISTVNGIGKGVEQ